MAFAIASGLTPQAGIYCAIITGFLISALGGSRFQIGGPTGAFVVVVAGIIDQYGVDGLFMCTMMAGVMLVIMGLTGTGTAVKYIPRPVIIGFTNGIALVIASTQLRDFLGLTIDVPGEFIGRIAGDRRQPRLPCRATASRSAPATLLLLIVWSRYVKRVPAYIVALFAGTGAAVALRARCRHDRIALRRHPVGPAAFSGAGVSAGPDPDAALAGLDGRDARRDRIAAVGGRRRSHGRRSPQPQHRALRARRRQHRVAAVRRTCRRPARSRAPPPTFDPARDRRSPGMIHALTLLAVLLFGARLAAYVPLPVLAAILFVVAWNMGEWREIGEILKQTYADVAGVAGRRSC